MMTTSKRSISILLCLTLVLSLLPATATAAEIVDSGTCGDNTTYALDADGLLTISGTGTISNQAFEDNTTIKKLVVEPGVTGIGSDAFYACTSLTTATLPEGLTSIGYSAFAYCDSLTSVTLPDGLTSIGEDAFHNCDSLTTITIPDSVTEIGYSPFNSCDNLQGIWVDPNNAHYSNDDAGVLFDKEKTTLIQAPGSIAGPYTAPLGLSSIGISAFEDCTGLTSVTLPEELNIIGGDAFSNCTGLTSVTLPEELNIIGGDAFSNCNLINITIPDSVTYIGSSSFNSCDNLQGIWVDPNNAHYSNDDAGVLFNKEKTTLIQAPGAISGAYAAPQGLTTIEDSAFYKCSSLTSVTLRKGLTSIGYDAFYGCNSLTSVTLPEGLTTIEDSAFYKCSSLTSVTLLEGLTSIGSSAFAGCNSLTTVTLPEGLTSIEVFTFSQCDSLTSVTLPKGLTSIGDFAFQGCTSLTSVTLPEGLTSIRDSAFVYCDSLTTITIPASVTKIGNFAFRSCDGLQGIWVDPNNTYYSNDDVGVLFDKEKTTLIQAPGDIVGAYTAPQGLTSIGDSAFYNCNNLTSLTLPEGLTNIGNDAFYCCYRLTSVSLPEGLTSIGSKAFAYCYDLDCLIFLGSLPSIDPKAFYSSSPTVYYPAGDPTWNDDAFQKYGGTPTYKELGDPVELRVTIDDPYYLVDQTVEKDHLDVELVYSSGAWSRLPHYQFTMQVDDMTTPGAKNLTISSHGFETTEVIYVHRGGTDTDPATWPESKHNYSHNIDETRVLTVPGATQIQITFSDQTFVEDGYDYIYVYDRQDAQLGKYTGNEAAGATVMVQGDRVKIRLVTDSTGNGWGYSLSDVQTSWIEHEYDSESGSCTICGSICDHDWSEPTCTTAKTCRKCCITGGQALGHTYKNGACVICGEPDPDHVTLTAPEITSCYSKVQNSVKVTWTAVEGADGYQIYRSETPDGSSGWKSIKTVTDGKQINYTNQGLTVGVTYYYKVRAYVQNGSERIYSDFSEVKFMPAAVVWDDPYSNATFRNRLRWDAVGSAHGYQIWRQAEDGSWAVVKTIGDRGNTLTNDQGDVTAYSNTSLTAGGKYTYKMRAFYIDGKGGKIYGPYSDEITVSVQPETPVVTVTSPKTERAQIGWTVDSAADGYQVWMSESESSGFSIVKSVTDGDTISYTKSGLTSGKTYYFKVRAYTEVNGKKTFGAYSDTIKITIK